VINLTLVFRDHNQGNIESVTILQRSDLSAQNQHLYGFADDGSPFCSPEYDGSIVFTVGPPPVPFGFEDTDLDGLGNSCVVQGVVDPNQDLTAQDVDFFAFAGQSNAEGHFTEGSIGVDAFRNTIFNRTGFDTLVINEAVGHKVKMKQTF